MKCNDVFFCRLCGAFSGTRARDLHNACPKQAVGKSRQLILKKLLQGKSPYAALAAESATDHPRECCWWLDPAANEVFQREPTAVRKSRGKSCRLAAAQPAAQQQPLAPRRPLWTAEVRDRLSEEISLLAGRELSHRRAATQSSVARLALSSQRRRPNRLDDSEPETENDFSLE